MKHEHEKHDGKKEHMGKKHHDGHHKGFGKKEMGSSAKIGKHADKSGMGKHMTGIIKG